VTTGSSVVEADGSLLPVDHPTVGYPYLVHSNVGWASQLLRWHETCGPDWLFQKDTFLPFCAVGSARSVPGLRQVDGRGQTCTTHIAAETSCARLPGIYNVSPDSRAGFERQS
jgi:hypothetical protein